jgi:hypothetical protein
VTVSGDGYHTVAYSAVGGPSGTADIPIDTQDPTATASIGSPSFTTGGTSPTTYVAPTTNFVVGVADAGSGIASCSIATTVTPGPSPTVPCAGGNNNFTLGSRSEGPYTVQSTVTASDNVGHAITNQATPQFNVTLDKTAPAITITRPAASATYNLNQTVTASYACTDVRSGVAPATCKGPVASGANIETNTVGAKTFTVNATDNVSNTSSKTVTYYIGYNICLLYDPAQPFKLSNSTVPIKLKVCDDSGVNKSSPSVVLKAIDLQKLISGQWKTVAKASDNSLGQNSGGGYQFRFNTTLASGGGYIYNYGTKTLTTGTYRLRFNATNEASGTAIHSAQFSVK